MSTGAAVASDAEGMWARPLRWEYRTIVQRMGAPGWGIADRDPSTDGGITLRPLGEGSVGSELSRLLNRMGSEGWELISQVADELVFKRPLP